jgi:uncharacterized protein
MMMNPSGPQPLQPDDYDALEEILEELRTRSDSVPSWEFCEGFMAALICCRRVIAPSEYLDVLLGVPFADAQQAERFLMLWMRRWNEVALALNNEEVEDLQDERAYHPELMDLRSLVAELPPEERAVFAGDLQPPALAQLWAHGFLAAVQAWPEEWVAPRGDKEAAQSLDEALAAIERLAQDDTGEPVTSLLGEDRPPSISLQRLEDLGNAIWAVYELRDLWRSIGPRVQPLRRQDSPGRNEPCPCGSGRKYKHCHGAQ